MTTRTASKAAAGKREADRTSAEGANDRDRFFCRSGRKQFKLGKYDIIAQPASGSMHMLRYTVMLEGKRLGALLSMPTESDCRFLEAPPKVPPLKVFQVTYRPGRPKKSASTPSANSSASPPHEGEDGPTIAWSIKGQQRY